MKLYSRLRIGFTLCVFFMLILTIGIYMGLEILLEKTRILSGIDDERLVVLIICCAASLLIGSFIASMMLYIPMQPLKKLLNGMNRLASGHFEERLDFGAEAPLKDMADTFNTLAGELQNTELLRSDFINHFSHEFKTPIVSIRGFARLLQRPGITEAERMEYAGVIVDESTRLSEMATNVLNLTKLENQSILTSTQEFNLSEQLRRCVLLLEKKWDSKALEIEADFPEMLLCGDEALLQQVWVNLLDNAIKFSPTGGRLQVRLAEQEGWIVTSISNEGPPIPSEHLPRLYDKFWQGDSSRAAAGTGIGLSIVRRVVELHGGQISARSTPGETVFSVRLPGKK